LLKNRIIEFFHYSITPVLQYSKELSKGKEPYEDPFQGAKAKPGPFGLDSLFNVVNTGYNASCTNRVYCYYADD